MGLLECKQLLKTQYTKDLSQSSNISKLTNDAWWSNKVDCYKQFGGTTQINTFLNEVRKWTATQKVDIQKTKEIVQEETTPTENLETTQEVSNNFSFISDFDLGGASLKTYGLYLLGGFISIIVIIFLMKLLIYMLTFTYDVMNVKRIKYLKVMLPRGDGKADREKAKEIAKDMKEKIGRMSQVFNNIYKLGQLWAWDGFMKRLFKKPKITFIYHYEDWQLSFLVGTYPEYQNIVESAISAQYPNCSIETVKAPDIFAKKHYEAMPMQPVKEPAYTIKMYKQLPDDPINNIIDSIGKVSRYDTVSIVMPIKPVGEGFNKRAKELANALFKKDKSKIRRTPFWQYLLMPWKIFKFLLNGPSKDMISHNDDWSRWDPMIRMVKAQEDSLNAMWEEAAYAAFKSGIMVVTTSDDKDRLRDNINNIVSAYNVYSDQYANELDNPDGLADILWFIVNPLWKIAVQNRLTNFFYEPNIFSINELSSVFHFPDGTYNRSPIIWWMQYKVLPAPSNLPTFSDHNGYIMSGIVAEKYKWGKLSKILDDYKKHWAVWEKTITEEKLEPIENFTKKQLKNKDIVEVDGKQMVKTIIERRERWYKLYKEWVLLWVNIYRNRYSPVYMKRNDRTRHHYCIGKSGTWKSVYLQTIARQDIWNGDGICLIDPHGDLAEDMLEFIPKERARDVIFFDAGNEDRPMGLNLYEIESLDEADRTVNDATEIFIKMFWPEIFGPRIQEYFKYGSLTLLEDFEDKPTILDVPRLFTDEVYREYKIKKVTNPVVKNFWDKTYNAMGDREKQEIIPYFTSKFVSFNTNRLIRNIIGQTKSWFDIADVMNNQKILLISLSKGKIWEINAQLLGMILVSKIYNAAMGRAKIPQEDRKDFYLYVDEFQNFVSGTFADILSEARKYRLCLIMAHQYIAQLEAEWNKWWGKADVKAAVFGNVWTMQSFKIGAPDAEFLEKEYAPALSAQDIVGIANYKAYIKLNINNSTTRVFSMNSIYTMDYKNKKIAPILKEYSAKKYGRKREFVDAEINARLGLWVEEEKLDQELANKEKSQQPNPVVEAPGPVQEQIQAQTTEQNQQTTTDNQ